MSLTPEKVTEALSEVNCPHLPPPLRAKLAAILTDHADAILSDRASVVHERRGDGRRYWRLYLESGSGECRQRRRVYVGPQGGEELRQAIAAMRRDFWGDYGGPNGFLRALAAEGADEAREARRAAREARQAALALTHRHLHGRRVRTRRNVSAVDRYRTEYRHLSRKALEAATWPGITEEQYITLRKTAERSGRTRQEMTT